MSDFQMWSGGYEGPIVRVPDERVHDMFARQVDRAPERIAVEYRDITVSYGELDARANRLAAYIRRRGAGPGTLVGVHLRRGVEMVIAVLAVGKTGAAYVMLDPDHPKARLRAAVEDAGMRMVVTDSTIAAATPWPDVDQLCLDAEASRIAECSAQRVEVAVNALSPACVMFTSGSTGRPKGAVASHRTLRSWFLRPGFLDLSPARVWLQVAPVSWDVFATELFGALLFGGHCVLQPGQKPDPATIARLVPAHGVDTLCLTSGLFALMLDEYPEIFGSLRQVMFGGEPPSHSHVVDAHRRFPHLRLVNSYGGVETALVETYHVVCDDDHARITIPIGRPETNTRAHVLDDALRPAEKGDAGEIYITGPGMVDGYIGQPGLTSGRFVANPFGPPGERMYRTGDVARFEPDGTMILLGRTDDQVKVRGFRVELREIEATLSGHPDVRQAVALVRQAPSGAARVIAYVTSSRPDLSEDVLRDHARTLLPEHSVPDAVVLIDRLPLTATGKVDRGALPSPVSTGDESRRPRTEEEEALRNLFATVLNVPDVGVEDNFFKLGGDSLTAARLVNRIRMIFGSEVNHETLFTAPTVARLAPLLTSAKASSRPPLRKMPRDPS